MHFNTCSLEGTLEKSSSRSRENNRGFVIFELRLEEVDIDEFISSFDLLLDMASLFPAY